VARASEPPPPPSVEPSGAPTSGDWRDVLRATGSAPPTPPQRTSKAVASPEENAPPPFLASSRPEPDSVTGAPSSSVTPADLPAGITVGTDAGQLFTGPLGTLRTVDEISTRIVTCTLCALHRTATNPVPGEGSAHAELVCVGEAPGATEDETGRPFVGQAGQLLTKILAAINLRREDVFICNVLKHRPPGNRNPLPDEVAACSPYLIRQLELIRPKVILALGTFAAQTLLETKLSIGKLRGAMHRYHGIPLIVTYHPAALLRNPAWKRPTWEDVQLARRILDRAGGA